MTPSNRPLASQQRSPSGFALSTFPYAYISLSPKKGRGERKITTADSSFTFGGSNPKIKYLLWLSLLYTTVS